MKIVAQAFRLSGIARAQLWDSWHPGQHRVQARVTLFENGFPFGVAALDCNLHQATDAPRWVLSQDDKDFVISSISEGVRQVCAQFGKDPEGIMLAAGMHNGATPQRAVYGDYVVEQEPIALNIGADGRVSPLSSDCVMSFRNVLTGLSYDDTMAPGGEEFQLDLPAGRYAITAFPMDRRYSLGGGEYEIA